MNKFSIAEAEKDFFQIINAAVAGEPQIIVENAVEIAVIISYEKFLELTEEVENASASRSDGLPNENNEAR